MQKVNSRLLVLEMLLSVTKDGQGVHSHIAVREVLNKYNYQIGRASCRERVSVKV